MSSLETWLLGSTMGAHLVGLKQATQAEFRKVVDQYSEELQVLRDVLEGVLDSSLLSRITKTDLSGLLDAATRLALSKVCFKTIGEMASIQRDTKRRALVAHMVHIGGPRMPQGVFPEYERLVDQFEVLNSMHKKDARKVCPKSLVAWTHASTKDLAMAVKRESDGSWMVKSPSKHRLVLPSNTVWADLKTQSFVVLDVLNSALCLGYWDDLVNTSKVASFDGCPSDKFSQYSTVVVAHNRKTTKMSVMKVVEPWSVLNIELGTPYAFVHADMFGDIAVLKVRKEFGQFKTLLVVDTRFASLVRSFDALFVKFAFFESCLAWAVQQPGEVEVSACFFSKKTKRFKSTCSVVKTDLQLLYLSTTAERGVFVLNLTSDLVRVDLN